MRKSRQLKAHQKIILRDAGVFAVKMWIDGLKEVVFGFLALFAAVIDLWRGPQNGSYLFYKVMEAGKRVDEAIDPYHAKPPGTLPEPGEPWDTN